MQFSENKEFWKCVDLKIIPLSHKVSFFFCSQQPMTVKYLHTYRDDLKYIPVKQTGLFQSTTHGRWMKYLKDFTLLVWQM
jgi:hypothetical protein